MLRCEMKKNNNQQYITNIESINDQMGNTGPNDVVGDGVDSLEALRKLRKEIALPVGIGFLQFGKIDASRIISM